ncbi:DJ-1/PfpI family protein [Angustibacter peucedani]
MSSPRRRTIRAIAIAVLALVALAGIAVAGLRTTNSQEHSMPTAHHEPLPVSHPSKGAPYVVAVVLGASGTVTSDALGPYEVFASSPQFLVYTVAATRDPAPTQGGPAIVPTYTFTDTTSGRAPKPDVVVVPAVNAPDGEQEQALRAWVTQQADAGAHILGVCAGARVLAATGLLDGRTATSHWSRIGALSKQRPQVHWVRGQRDVQDGRITTTAGVTSGIPGALRVMADVAGRAEAAKVGASVAYPGWSLDGDTTIPAQSFAGSDWPVALNALMPLARPTLGIALRDGMGEIDVASAFEVYDVSYAARAVPLSDHGAITTRHGLVLTTNTLADTTVDRLAVPGAGGTADLDPGLSAWATAHHVSVDAMQASAPGFDGALTYLASRSGDRTAQSAAKMIDYPTAQLDLPGHPGSPRTLVLLGLALATVSAAAVALTRWA